MRKLQDFFNGLNNRMLYWTYLVVGVMFSIVSIIGPKVSGELVNAVIYEQESLQRNLLMLIGIYGLQMVFSVVDQYYANFFCRNQKKNMREDAFEAFISQPGLNHEKIASFVSFVNNDIPDIVENYFQGTVDIIKCVCITLGSSVALFKIHWLLACVIIGCSLLVVILPNFMKERAARCRKKCAVTMEQYNTILESFLPGTDIIKAYLYQEHANKRMAEESSKVEVSEEELTKCQLWVYGMTGFVQMVKTVLILTIGVYLIYIQRIKVGELLAAVQLAEMISAPIEVMAYLINGRNEVRPLVEQYNIIIEHVVPDGKMEVEKIEQIQVEHLSYCVGDVEILKDISHTFHAGKKYLLMGESGSGKTTLLKLLGRLCENDYSGEIYINGLPYRDVEESSFYKKIGIVEQEPYLFWMSLEDNILLGRAIEKEEYECIIDKLNLRYLLERFEGKKLNEEMVSQLSGGEKQRIALARAMISKPELYLLDEVTASLDEKNAYEIESTLLEEDAMVLHVCHKIVPKLREKYDEVICLE